MLLEESLIAKDDAQQHLIEYYRAFELLLSRQFKTTLKKFRESSLNVCKSQN